MITRIDKTSDYLFPDSIKMSWLAEAVGVSTQTLRNWKTDPSKIPKAQLEILIRVRHLSNEQILEMFGRKEASK